MSSAKEAVSAVQARYDRTLREKLGADGGVQRAIAKLEERRSGFGLLTRRNLLTGALRLRRKMVPKVAQALDVCREVAGYQGPIELYVKPEPVFNAFCARDPTGLVSIGLSSAMIEAFSPAEIQFVIGHELGHIVYDHFTLPMPLTAMVEDMAGRIVSRPMAIELYVWCRAAELSADRLGLLCARDARAAASSFFKLSSGLTEEHIEQDVDALSAQVDSIASAPSARKQVHDDDDTLDCFSTHPYNPLRVRALLAFAKSKLYRELSGFRDLSALGASELTMDDVEAVVERDLALMEPSYLEDKTAVSELMRELLLQAGLVVAGSSGAVEESEVRALRALLGSDMLEGKLDPSTAKGKLPNLADRIKKDASLAERTRLVQHLTIIAAADGQVDGAEADAMVDVAMRLGVPPQVIGETLRASSKPMD